MKPIRQSILAFLLVVGASLTCTGLKAQQQTPTRAFTAKLATVISEAIKIRPENPREALAMLEEVLAADPPAFDSTDASTAIESFTACRSLAHTYYEAAQAAHDSGYWEKEPDFYNKSGQVVTDALDKLREVFAKVSESYELQQKQVQALLEVNAEDIQKLKAKDEKDYTNEDYDAKEKMNKWESDLKQFQEGIQWFKNNLADREREAKTYNPDPPFAAQVMERIERQMAEINSYKAGPGDKSKWVEGIVASHAQYMANYKELADKIALAYRLMALAPESKTAPILLEVLKGRATQAELNKAVTATAQANRKKAAKK
jgi:DNA repair ATPase RecN